jgi:hypothetical protein
MASTYLTKSMSGNTASTKMTFSAWIKKSDNDTGFFRLFGTRDANHVYIFQNNIYFDVTNTSGTAIGSINTTRVLRDNHAFYHIVAVLDTTLSTATDRQKIYINGERVTDISVITQVSQDATTDFGANGVEYSVGGRTSSQGSAGGYFNGTMAHVHFTDGYAYQASTFGQTDATTGIWKPNTAPSVTYGTNGFFLKFENSNMGLDSSGNSNNFTVSGSMTQSISTPSNIFATLNPLRNFSSMGSFSNCNNTYSQGSNSWVSALSTLGVTSGKYYYEAKWVSGSYFKMGFCTDNGVSSIGHISETNLPGGYAWYTHDNGHVKTDDGIVSGWNHTDITNITSITTGSIMMIAVDMDNKFAYFGADGVWAKNGDPTSGSSGTGGLDISSDFPSGTPLFFGISNYNSVANVNFGEGFFGTTAVASAQNPDDGIGVFEYDVPAGYRSLCTKSINAEEYS